MLNPLPFAALALAATAVPASAQVGVPYCHGNGCPCANDDPSAGCGNDGIDGDPATGALLDVQSGTANIFLDDLTLRLSGIQASQFGLLFMGDTQVNGPFFDGLVCVGGAEIYRFDVLMSDGTGAFTDSSFVARSQAFGAGVITAGATWNFQGWYRDPNGPCGSALNLSNALSVTFHMGGPIATQLAGNALVDYPYFEYVRAFNEDHDVSIAVDPTRFPSVGGQTADVYIVAAKTEAEWALEPDLVDADTGPVVVTFSSTDVQSNTFVVNGGTLAAILGDDIGIGYDVVVDMDRDGTLGAGDFIDGLSDEAGMYMVRNTVDPGLHAVTEVLYSGGTWLGQNTFFPTDIATMGAVPLIVVSHGNGHNFQWYDHIGEHLASYGYIVMSHQNNTQPGINSASLTTLDNTDWFLGNLAGIAGGALVGHVDSSRIVWIGHSRGAEGVVRAYDRLFDGNYVPLNFTIDDIVLVSSMAPTDFLGSANANPHDVNYHLWTGSADADVSGTPDNNVAQTYHLLERATANHLSITIQGAGHAVFHNGSGSWVAQGPCLIGPLKNHKIMRGYLLPLVKHFLEQDVPSKDFLWRQWETFKPNGAPSVQTVCIVVTYEYKDGPATGNFVIDDFQSGPAPDLSSSGAGVMWSVTNLIEGLLDDNNSTFTWIASDPMNGMTRARPSDTPMGVVFEWDGPAFYEQAIVPAERDFTDDTYISLRACQTTRHPKTVEDLEDLTFTVTLRDSSGVSSSIGIGAYGGGIEEPFQRTGAGNGTGWGNEFETIRIRLTDFLANGSGLDLADVEAVRLDFGGTFGSDLGRIGLDDIELTKD